VNEFTRNLEAWTFLFKPLIIPSFELRFYFRGMVNLKGNSKSGKIFTIKNILIKSSGVLIFIVLWEIAPRLGWADKQFVPSFSEVSNELIRLLARGDLTMHIMVSLWRVLVGLIVASLIAIPLGFILSKSCPFLIEILNPMLRFLSQANPFTLGPIFILFFGVGELVKVSMIAWACIWPILFNVITGIKVVDPALERSARALNISHFQSFTKILLPSVGPWIYTGLSTGVEISFFMVVAAEMIGTSAGLGWLVHNAGMNNKVVWIYSAAVLIIALGVFIKWFLRYTYDRLFFWKTNTDFYSEDKEHKRFDKSEVIFIIFMLVVILGFGAQQIKRADYVSKNMGAHDHMELYKGTGDFQ